MSAPLHLPNLPVVVGLYLALVTLTALVSILARTPARRHDAHETLRILLRHRDRSHRSPPTKPGSKST
jgi:hypothetical protein